MGSIMISKLVLCIAVAAILHLACGAPFRGRLPRPLAKIPQRPDGNNTRPDIDLVRSRVGNYLALKGGPYTPNNLVASINGHLSKGEHADDDDDDDDEDD